MHTKDEILEQVADIFVKTNTCQRVYRSQFLAEMPDLDVYQQRKEKVLESRYATFDWMSLCYVEPLLTPAQEVHVFRKMNLLKWLARREANKDEIDLANHYFKQACEVRGFIILCNTRLIASCIKKMSGDSQDHEDVFAEVCSHFFRVVNKYDWRRGLKFSTYATWCIRRQAHEALMSLRGGVGKSTTKKREMQSNEELFQEIVGREDQTRAIQAQSSLQGLTKLVLKITTPRQMEIIERRYGLNGYGEESTLQQIANLMNITKERVRQIEKNGILAIQHALRSTHHKLRENIEEIIF